MDSAPSAPPPPSSQVYPTLPPQQQETSQETRQKKIASLYEIGEHYVKMLKQYLPNAQVTIVADNSGSMNSQTDMGTRWSELTTFVKYAIDIATAFSNKSVDLHFLNKHPPILNVQNFEQIKAAFNVEPDGYTPLTAAFSQALRTYAHVDKLLAHQKLIIVIPTDGFPTTPDGACRLPDGRSTQQEFIDALKHRPSNVYVNMCACTDDPSVNAFFALLDHLPGVDVIDDYKSETQKQLKAGIPAIMSFGEYVVKCILGSVVEELDKSSGF